MMHICHFLQLSSWICRKRVHNNGHLHYITFHRLVGGRGFEQANLNSEWVIRLADKQVGVRVGLVCDLSDCKKTGEDSGAMCIG